MTDKNISNAIIRRLPRYYRYLKDLMDEGVERISSAELSRRMSVTASQIRQDLNHFGGFGQQGYGYHVEYLYREIGRILGLDHINPMIVIGAGNLGRAIANYGNFEKRGFCIVGMFDRDPALVGKETASGVKIRAMEELEGFLKEHKVRIAALAIPKQEAQPIADILIRCGIRAFWNFAHVDLKVPADAVVENVHLSDSLMQLSYRWRELHPSEEE